MKRLLIAVLIVSAAGFVSAETALAEETATPQQRAETRQLDGWQGEKPKVDCQCRRPGGVKADLGEQMCARRGGRMVTLRCELALNNTIWKEISEGCEPVS